MVPTLNTAALAVVDALKSSLIGQGASFDAAPTDGFTAIQYTQPSPTRYQERLAELNSIVPPRGNTVVHNGQRVSSIYTQAEFDTIQREVVSLVARANERYVLTPEQEAEIRRSATRTQGLIALRNRGAALVGNRDRGVIGFIDSIQLDSGLTWDETERFINTEIPARNAILREDIQTLERQPGLQLRQSDLTPRAPEASSVGGTTASLNPSSYQPPEPTAADFFEITANIPKTPRIIETAIAA
ncbi:MAG: hypothetical protein J0M34_09125 [Alphaproteobacteria bacterium]|nr:hypothetical protein [Alphaproteobacteria bacterium]